MGVTELLDTQRAREYNAERVYLAYSTALQNTVDMSGKAKPKAPAAATVRQNEPAPAPRATVQGEIVAVIEARVNAGEDGRNDAQLSD